MDLETVISEMVLLKLNSGLGDQNNKKLINIKLLNTLTREDFNFNIIKV
jgi:hypothetical protein